jgi:hypothetical protein
MRYALRADLSDANKATLSKWLTENADGFIVARETVEGENPHIHAILETTKTLKAVRSSFVRAFPHCTGNKGYSLKVCGDDWDAYVRYICKGTKDVPPVIWSRCGLAYTDEVIKSAWEKYWVNNAAIEENRKKRIKVEKANIVEQIEKICKETGETDRKEIARVYIRLFRDARKGINVFAARAVVNTVWCLLGGDSAEEQLIYKIADLG